MIVLGEFPAEHVHVLASEDHEMVEAFLLDPLDESLDKL